VTIPKPQLYPASKIAVGAVLYSCAAWTNDAGKTSTEINEWIVRSIQAKRGTKTRMGFATSFGHDRTQYVNITERIDHVTWGKRSTKNGDYGWRKTIPSYCTRQFAVGSCLPRGIYTTVRAAILYETCVTRDYLADCKSANQADRNEDEIAASEAQYAALKRRFATLNSRPIKPSQSAPVAA
jgi:hypothetical protein